MSSLDRMNSVRLPDEIVRLRNAQVMLISTRKGYLYLMDESGVIWRCRMIKAKANLNVQS